MTAPPIVLRRMDEGEWAAWFVHQRRSCVADLVSMNGLTPAAAEAQAAAEDAALLPEGRATPGHHFFAAVAGGSPVATLWLGEADDPPHGHAVWVYDIETEPAARGRGFGRATMLAAEQEAGGLGAARIRLNVYAGNTAAIALYTSLGYTVTGPSATGQRMAKALR